MHLFADRLAAIDREIERLQKRHALAQSVADLADANRLQGEIRRLSRIKNEISEHVKRADNDEDPRQSKPEA